MPRGFRTRRAKEPAVPITYEEHGGIAEVAHRLIRLYPAHFGWTVNFALGYVMRRGSRPRSDRRFDALARFVRTPALWHGLAGFDAVILVEHWAWEGFAPTGIPALGPTEQEALIAHELCHGSMNEKGALRVERHDLEEFRFVVSAFGAWDGSIRDFAEQLALFETHGPAFRSPRAEQASFGEDPRPTGEVNPAALRGEAERSILDAPTPIRRRRNGQAPILPA